MTEPDEPTAEPVDFDDLFARADVAAAMTGTAEHPTRTIWARLNAAAEASAGNERVLLQALAAIASYVVEPDDWNQPYAATIKAVGDRRSPIPADLTPDELALLAKAAPYVPNATLRARVYDVLSISLKGQSKIDNAKASIDALLSAPISRTTWWTDHDAWDRGLTHARRLREPTRSRVGQLEQALRAVVDGPSDGFEALQAARLLAKHQLSAGDAGAIAQRLSTLAGAEDNERRRAYLHAASEWQRRAGDDDEAARLLVEEVQSFMTEAEAIAAENAHPFRSAHLFEQALQTVRELPRAQRERLGVADTPAKIARRIRELGAKGLGSLVVFESETIDLSTAARDARDRVKDRPVEEALLEFAGLNRWIAIDEEIRRATETIKEHPLHTLVSTRHFSTDGRTIYRSGGAGGAPIYGVDPGVWDDLVRMHEWRIDLIARGVLWPAYVQLTSEHHLSILDFTVIVANTGLVPKDRINQFARALYYGFNGDFSTAMQLLVPQVENLVRAHMLDAGLNTTTIRNGVEEEIGLSNLMDREEVETIFGRDLAFEIRLLFCGPTGPNVRNDVAHGLISDSTAGGSKALYTWWFGMCLVYVAFWNALHDTEAAEAREPAQPREPEASETPDCAPPTDADGTAKPETEGLT